MKNTMNDLIMVTKVVSFLSLFTPFAFADENLENHRVDSAVQSEEDQSVEDSYPGKVSRDSEGNKIKRWSTRGPVKVNPPPRPFEDPQLKKLPSGTFISIDDNKLNSSRLHNQAKQK